MPLGARPEVPSATLRRLARYDCTAPRGGAAASSASWDVMSAAGLLLAGRPRSRCTIRRHGAHAGGRLPAPQINNNRRLSIDGTISQAAGMQSWIRDLIDLKTQISVLQNCMHAASQQPCTASQPLQGCRQCEPWTGAPRKYTFLYKCTSGFSSVLSACGTR